MFKLKKSRKNQLFHTKNKTTKLNVVQIRK